MWNARKSVVCLSLFAALGLAAALTLASCGGTPTPSAERSLTIAAIEGSVEIVSGGEGSSSAAQVGQQLAEADEVRTASASRAVLEMDDGTLLVAEEGAVVGVTSLDGTPEVPISRFSLSDGLLYALHDGTLPEGASLEVVTPSGTGAILGSSMGIGYLPESGGGFMWCLTGDCRFSPPNLSSQPGGLIGPENFSGGQKLEFGPDGPHGDPAPMHPIEFSIWLDLNDFLRGLPNIPVPQESCWCEPGEGVRCVGNAFVPDFQRVTDFPYCPGNAPPPDCFCVNTTMYCTDGTTTPGDPACVDPSDWACICGPSTVSDNALFCGSTAPLPYRGFHEEHPLCTDEVDCACSSLGFVCDGVVIPEGSGFCGIGPSTTYPVRCIGANVVNTHYATPDWSGICNSPGAIACDCIGPDLECEDGTIIQDYGVCEQWSTGGGCSVPEGRPQINSPGCYDCECAGDRLVCPDGSSRDEPGWCSLCGGEYSYCGNGLADPWCGEDPRTCPEDCTTNNCCNCRGHDQVCGDFTLYNTEQCNGSGECECRGTTLYCPDGTVTEGDPACENNIPPGGGGGGAGEPTQPPTDQPTEVVTQPPAECGPGWLPASGCSCCGTTLTCADGTIAEFNPTCMGGGPPDVCGDGICSPAEGAVCGTCSADCGPC